MRFPRLDKTACTALGILFLGFALVPGPAGRAHALSIQDERILGDEFLAQVQGQYELLPDGAANEYINNLGTYLARFLSPRPFTFHFYIINDGTLNAFAGPGGHIFVFTGLIALMDNVDELAGVLAHEIAHSAARHLSQRIEQGQKISLATLGAILAAVFLGGGGEATQAVIAGASAAGAQAQLSYSREDERQADQMGFGYMQAAGFDYAGMIRTLKKIHSGQWAANDQLPPYLLTHPTGPERMANLDALVTRAPPAQNRQGTAAFAQLFPYFKTTILVESRDVGEAGRTWRARAEAHPDDPVALYGMGLAVARGQDYEHAETALQKAYALEPQNLAIITALGATYLAAGDYAAAEKVLRKGLELDDSSRALLYNLGMAYVGGEAYPYAVRIFERLALMPPVRPEVYYQLGMAYGRQNQLAPAHYNFGVYFINLGQLTDARFHLEKARALSGPNDPLTQKIKRLLGDFREGESRP